MTAKYRVTVSLRINIKPSPETTTNLYQAAFDTCAKCIIKEDGTGYNASMTYYFDDYQTVANEIASLLEKENRTEGPINDIHIQVLDT